MAFFSLFPTFKTNSQGGAKSDVLRLVEGGPAFIYPFPEVVGPMCKIMFWSILWAKNRTASVSMFGSGPHDHDQKFQENKIS